jgi:hypothetical protein
MRRVCLFGCAIAVALLAQLPASEARQDTLPTALPDAEFWSLVEAWSEPNGEFRSNSGSSDNLLSNENELSTVAAALPARIAPLGVYLGVGPEQNFTYIAAVRPKFAVIIDIRRGNLHVHLLYKAIFEMSADRADFVALLFSRARPAELGPSATAADLIASLRLAAPADDASFATNLDAVVSHLTRTRRLPLPPGDVAGIEYVYRQLRRFGPDIHYTSTSGGRRSGWTYAALMSTTDGTGAERSYLSTETSFRIVKQLQSANAVVPIVGDFAGPTALRDVGRYLRSRGAVVNSFYVSNVETYLDQAGASAAFCANVAALPLDASSTFIRPGGPSRMFGSMAAESAQCAGR